MRGEVAAVDAGVGITRVDDAVENIEDGIFDSVLLSDR